MPYVDLENVNKSTVVSELKTVIGKKISWTDPELRKAYDNVCRLPSLEAN